MGVPINNVSRRVVYAASGTGPYAFTFEILAAADIAVYKDDTLLTLTTDYTVTINANGTGSITLTASPTGATQIAIVGNRTIQRLTDFVTGGDLFANTINDELDQQTIFAQQNAEGLDRSLKAPQTDPTSINMTLPRASVRANKTLAFDANGNPTTGEVIGDNRGNWAAGTAYNKRDIVKDTSNGNIYYANTAHTSSGSQPISSNADSAKWDLIVDNAAAGASASAAAASASAAASSASAASTSASNASSSASSAASSASAASTSASNASTSATNAASSASTASTQASNAATSATNAANSATSASNSASTATTQATNASNSASSASTSATNAANSASSASSSASSASSSASSASTSASNAASSATAAAASATSAAASYDSFDDRYLGAKTSDPTLDNDGNALLTGALYFNSSTGEMKVYSGSAWVSSFLTTGAQTITGVKTFASNPILSAGTANGVAYLNGSKVLTTGSALTFDGTNLGVGVTSVGAKIQAETNASSGDAAVIAVSKTGLGYTTTLGYYASAGTATAGVVRSANNLPLAFETNNAEGMRLTSTGLGIGTSSPAYKLDVSSASTPVARFTGAANAYVDFTDGTVTSRLQNSGALLFGTTSNHSLLLRTNSTTQATLDTSGNLGLGVTPSAWGADWRVLEMQYSSAGQAIAGLYPVIAANAYNNGTNWIYKNSAQASYYSQVLGQHRWFNAASGTAGNAISFSQVMTLSAAGSLGIGVSSPGYQLHVKGTDASATVESADATSAMRINAQSGLAILETITNTDLRIRTNSTERARIVTDGLQMVKSIGLGGTAPNSSGVGITFPSAQSASSDANTLDDYEEGTFTPVIVGTTSAGTGTYTLQAGWYTKIGNQVFITITIRWTAHTGTGNMKITGLPFTSNNATTNPATYTSYFANIALTANNVPAALQDQGTSEINLRQLPTGGGAATNVPMDTAGEIEGLTGFYRV